MADTPQEDIKEARTKLMDQVRRSLGGSMIDLELDPEDYELAIDKALEKYRQKSDFSTEESHAFLELQKDQTTYTLPQEIIEVRQIFRRSIGHSPGAGSGVELDPFDVAYTNIYLLYAGRQQGLLTYALFTMWQETAGKLFGFWLNFTWNPDAHKLQIHRKPVGNETVLLWVHNEKPEQTIIRSRYSGPWIRDYATAEAKIMLGNAYRKFSNIPGPGGSISLPGSELISEGKEEKEDLETRIHLYESGEEGLTFRIG